MNPYFIIILILVMTIILVLFGIIQEQKLIKTFEDNDLLLSNEEIILLSNEHIETLDLILVNLGVLPSCKGEYCSILFKNRFQLNCYKEFDILTLSTYVTSYSIKLSKTASSIKNDFLIGKFVEINVNGQNLLFKFPKDKRNLFS